MTWRADEVMIRASRAAVQAVRADALLSPFAHLLPNVLRNPSGATGPRPVDYLPPEGLLVLRPIGNVTHDDTLSWYQEPVLDWGAFPGPGDARFEADRLRVAEATDMAAESLPPTTMLAYLSDLARRTQSALLVYSCSMWGGDVESEQAWVIGKSNLALVNRAQGDSPGQILTMDGTGPIRVVEGDVLSMALEHLGVKLPTPYFLPHTRAFSWREFRLAPT